MTEPLDPGVVAVCFAYATTRCSARMLEFQLGHNEYSAALASAAYRLVSLAPGKSGPHLDCIKRIMEIDQATTDPNVILMRASVITEDASKRWEMKMTNEPLGYGGDGGSDLIPVPSFTCRQCGMTSYNPNDIEQRYCGNCKTWETIVP